jgi:hypothetical protein
MNQIERIYTMLKEGDISFEGSHNIHTPRPLVDRILSSIKLDGSILVIFNVEFVASLVYSHNVDPKNITLLSDHEDKSYFCKKIGANYINKLETSMKFDVIVGNPPYQDTTAPTLKLWPTFLEKSVQLTVDGGYIGFITPRAWIERPNSQLSGRIVKNILKVYQLEQVDITSEKYFNIGESPCSYIIHKIPKHSTTKFIFEDRTEDIDYVGQKVPLNTLDTYKISIFDKFQKTSNTRLSTVVYNDTGVVLKINDMLKTGVMSNSIVNQDDVKVFWTASQDSNYWMPVSKIKPGIKVILNRSGYFYKENKPDHYIRLDLNQEYGIGAGAYGITVNSEQEGRNLISLLTTRLYQWYIKHEKTSGFNTGITKLPLLNISKSWTDDEIFDLFGIEDTERSLINDEFSTGK